MKKRFQNNAKSLNKKKTITRTFRINVEWDEIIKKEAERQGISVSSILNKILKKYSVYSRWTDRFQTINLSSHVFKEILNSIQVENLSEAGSKCGAVDPINIINILGLANDYDSFVYLLTEYFDGPSYANWFSCFHHKQKNNDVFHLQHDLGRKWNIFLEKYLQSFLKSITDLKVKTRIYDYAITLEVTP